MSREYNPHDTADDTFISCSECADFLWLYKVKNLRVELFDVLRRLEASLKALVAGYRHERGRDRERELTSLMRAQLSAHGVAAQRPPRIRLDHWYRREAATPDLLLGSSHAPIWLEVKHQPNGEEIKRGLGQCLAYLEGSGVLLEDGAEPDYQASILVVFRRGNPVNGRVNFRRVFHVEVDHRPAWIVWIEALLPTGPTSPNEPSAEDLE